VVATGIKDFRRFLTADKSSMQPICNQMRPVKEPAAPRQAIPKILINMPASSAIASARRTKPRNVRIGRCCPEGVDGR
jgi:hypothetical protein